MADLGKLFSSDVVKNIQQLQQDIQATGLTDTVGTGAFTPKQMLKVHAGSPQIDVHGAKANFDAQASAQVSIEAQGATIAPFDSSAALEPPANSSWALLEVKGTINGGIDAEEKRIPLSISAKAAASFTYDHYAPAADTDTRLAALAKLLTTANVPQLQPLSKLQPGEISSFQAALSIDLGLKAKYGSSFDIASTIGLFDGLSAQLKAHVQYSLEASLGWSVFDDMKFVVGRAQTTTPGWVRVRVERSDRKTFTAGAVFALQVDYDASSLADAVQKAFNMTPLRRVISVLQTAATVDFDTLKQTVSDRASEEVIGLIAGTNWKQKAASDPTIVAALADINKVVSAFNQVDTKVKQLWNGLLARLDLSPGTPLRNAIEKIANLTPQSLQQFLGGATGRELELLESLAGQNVEQLIIGSEAAIEGVIETASNLAKQLLRVINDTPASVMNAIQQFEQRFGLRSAIDFLAHNATSLDSIEAFGDSIIKEVISKAVGKAFDAIGTDEFAKVQAWAKKVIAQWDTLSAKLAAAAKFLKGQVGFNVSLEMSRVSEQSAVLDFEFDPADGTVTGAVQQQLSATVSKMLNALNDLRQDHSASLRIREALIISRHLRTGVASTFLSFVGLSKVTATQFDESIIRTDNTGREATFSGGFTQVGNFDATGECRTWIAAEASDGQISDTLSFAPPAVSRSLNLTFAHHGVNSTAAQRSAIEKLLEQLGFMNAAGASAPNAATGTETIFAINISLGDDAVRTLVSNSDEDTWNRDYRNSAVRLLSDALFDRRTLFNNGPRVADAEAGVIGTDLWTNTWTDTSQQKFVTNPLTAMLAINGKGLHVVAGNTIIPPYLELKQLIIQRPNGLRKLPALKQAVENPAIGSIASLQTLASEASAFFAATSLDIAENPMFLIWFVVARLCRLGPGTLTSAKGAASFRVRPQPDAPFDDPQQWSLTQAVGIPITKFATDHVFPF
ncbi:MAG TPA: hypothetical protein VII75_13580 [Thermoanaerobaculia bacterium]